MSAPNKTYDPVEVAVLAPEEVQRMQAEALAAIEAAADLDGFAGDPFGFRGSQKRNHRCDVSGLSDTTERRLCLHVRHRPVEASKEDVGQCGVNHPG